MVIRYLDPLLQYLDTRNSDNSIAGAEFLVHVISSIAVNGGHQQPLLPPVVLGQTLPGGSQGFTVPTPVRVEKYKDEVGVLRPVLEVVPVQHHHGGLLVSGRPAMTGRVSQSQHELSQLPVCPGLSVALQHLTISDRKLNIIVMSCHEKLQLQLV